MKKKVIYPIIVEGRYDKIKLDSIFDAEIFVCNGFGVFNSKERQELLRRISERGVILLVDSDGGGAQIRSFLNSIIPKDKIHNLYIPKIAGKEKRKDHASKSGTLGVEGMERAVLERVLEPFTDTGENKGVISRKSREMITNIDFFNTGLTGGANSSALRDKLAREFSLPEGMGAKALLEVLNLITDREGYLAALDRVLCGEELE